ncbi:hypothetical protein SUGI_1044340 [Cryptomeria japonica]|nr:hypothetical protein SUGI_1044340 [Cryptomeria japonica]
MDGLQYYDLLEIILDDSVQLGFLKQGELFKCVQKYNLGSGNGYILGVFPRWDLKHTKSGEIYDAFILSLRNDNPWQLYSALQTYRHEIGADKVKVLKDIYFAISFLLILFVMLSNLLLMEMCLQTLQRNGSWKGIVENLLLPRDMLHKFDAVVFYLTSHCMYRC